MTADHEQEPTGISMRQLRESPWIDESIRDLCIQVYIKQRSLISNVQGVVELAWRRGYDEGYEMAKSGEEKYPKKPGLGQLSDKL